MRQAFLLTWRTSFSWSPVPYLCGLPLAVALLAAVDNIAPWTVLLGLPMCWGLTVLYRYHAENTFNPDSDAVR